MGAQILGAGTGVEPAISTLWAWYGNPCHSPASFLESAFPRDSEHVKRILRICFPAGLLGAPREADSNFWWKQGELNPYFLNAIQVSYQLDDAPMVPPAGTAPAPSALQTDVQLLHQSGKYWLPEQDSNLHDDIQSVASYQLDDPAWRSRRDSNPRSAP
jgi:hypothetical protein